jgi:protein TonB
VAPDASQIINPDTVSQQVALGPNLAAGDPNADPNEVLDISQIDNRTGNPGSATEVGDAVPQEEHTVLTVNEAPVPVNLDEFMRAIQYPEPARNAGITGTVTVRVLVDDNGRYAKHKVLRSPHPWLTQEVERHLPSIRFTPAIANNRAVVCWLTVPIKFQL